MNDSELMKHSQVLLLLDVAGLAPYLFPSLV